MGENFLDKNLKAQSIKEKNWQMGLHQTKKHLHSKGDNHRVQKQPTEWEKIANHLSNKGLIPRIYNGTQNTH